MTHANQPARRVTDAAYISPFAPFRETLAPATSRDYTETPAYEMPPIARTAIKLREIILVGTVA